MRSSLLLFLLLPVLEPPSHRLTGGGRRGVSEIKSQTAGDVVGAGVLQRRHWHKKTAEKTQDINVKKVACYVRRLKGCNEVLVEG